MFACTKVSVVARKSPKCVHESYSFQVAVGELHAMEVLKTACRVL